jgi:hypothetical protein
MLDEKGAGGVFEQALKLEVEGWDFYMGCARNARTKEEKDMFRGLAEDEKEHYERIEGMYASCALDAYQSFQARYNGDYWGSGVFENIQAEGLSPGEILEVGVEAEKKSMQLYSSLRDNAFGQDVKDALTLLIKEEEEHLRILIERLGD